MMRRGLSDLAGRYDAIVVGGRVAGSATAMLLARSGARVLVVEQGAPGADTLSTLALMRGGVLQLSRWGLLDEIRAAGTPPIETSTFHYDGDRVEVRIKRRDGVDALFAPRRTLLDPVLALAAQAAGADIAWHVRCTDVVRDATGRVSGVMIEAAGEQPRRILADVVIGADGLHSSIARIVGAAAYRTGRFASAVIYTFVQGLQTQGYHWHYVPGASVGVIPTGGGDTLVFVSITRDRFMRELRPDLAAGFQRILHEVAPWLAGAVRVLGTSPFRGFAGHESYVRPAWGPGWALVGDAGYHTDPLTAHGITGGLRDAELLARAVCRGNDASLAAYQATRDDLSRDLFEVTDEIASFEWSMPRIRELHRMLSDAMNAEVQHLSHSSEEGYASLPLPLSR